MFISLSICRKVTGQKIDTFYLTLGIIANEFESVYIHVGINR